MTTPSSNLILLGTIGAAHGIKGQVRIATHTQDPEAIASYGPLATDRDGLVVTLSKVRLHKNVVVAHIKGISDRTAAEQLNGVNLYVERSKLPDPEDEDDFYHADLLGLEARLDSGVVIGTVSPTSLPIRARATGAPIEILPFLMLASCSPTIV